MEPEVVAGGGGEAGGTGTPEASVSQPSEPNLADEIIRDLNAAPPAEATPPPAKPGLSPEMLKQLETLNPEELPQSLKERFEKPFLSQYGKKTTAWDNERQSYLNLIDNLGKRLEASGGVPQNTKAKVSEHLANGEYEAAEAALREEMRQEITPERNFISTQIALNEAKSLMPDLAKYEQAVAQGLTSDPVLGEMSQIANRKYAGRILAGLAFQAKCAALEQYIEQSEKTFETRLRQAIDETQRRIKGLPSSTSRAGSTASATPASKPANLRDAMEAAWIEAGGS